MSKKQLFERVDKLPGRKFGEKVKVYSEVLDDIQRQPKGVYKINIPKKPKTVYMALRKRIKQEKLTNLKVHDRLGTIYIEVL
jgi:hypothetical protein